MSDSSIHAARALKSSLVAALLPREAGENGPECCVARCRPASESAAGSSSHGGKGDPLSVGDVISEACEAVLESEDYRVFVAERMDYIIDIASAHSAQPRSALRIPDRTFENGVCLNAGDTHLRVLVGTVALPCS